MMMTFEGFGRVRGTISAEFLVAGEQAVDAVHRERGHCESMERGGDGLDGAMRRDVGGDQQHRIEPQRVSDGARGVEVSAVNRIEGAAENADAFDHALDDSSVDGLALTAVHMASSSAGTPSPVAADTA